MVPSIAMSSYICMISNVTIIVQFDCNIVYAIDRPIYETRFSMYSCTLCALERCHINVKYISDF